MTIKKKNFVVAIVLIHFFACSEIKDSDIQKESESDTMTYPMQSVMVNNNQCQLHGEFVKLKAKNIIGTWRDSLFWKMQPNDSCFYGINELDKTVKLEIKKTKTYVLSTEFSRPEYNRVETGEYFLDYDSSITTLILAENPAGEKLFEHGDTMYNSVVYDLRWIDDSTMILVGDVEIKGHRLREGIEYKKTTR